MAVEGRGNASSLVIGMPLLAVRMFWREHSHDRRVVAQALFAQRVEIRVLDGAEGARGEDVIKAPTDAVLAIAPQIPAEGLQRRSRAAAGTYRAGQRPGAPPAHPARPGPTASARA